MIRVTQDTDRNGHCTCTGLSPAMAGLSRPFYFGVFFHDSVLQPHICLNRYGLGSSPFARHYLGNHYLFSFPAGTKMFQFPALAPLCGDMPSAYQVVPFGNLRFKGYLLLDAAYRSLSRPSSPPRAKASTVCPFVLFFFHRPFARSGRIYYKLLYSLLFLYNMSMIEFKIPVENFK